VADLRARKLELTTSSVREALADTAGLEQYRVVIDALAGEHDLVEIALAAIKLAHVAQGGDVADDEREIPRAALPHQGPPPPRPARAVPVAPVPPAPAAPGAARAHVGQADRARAPPGTGRRREGQAGEGAGRQEGEGPAAPARRDRAHVRRRRPHRRRAREG